MEASSHSDRSFRHEAAFYAGSAGFLEATVPFITDGLRNDEAVLVVVLAAKIDALQDCLGGDAARVQFADMAEIGINPARIIPAWRQFADESSERGRAFRGVGEPIWAARRADELVECLRHEALLNLAFAGTPGFQLLCPYDTDALGAQVLDEARATHPAVVQNGCPQPSHVYRPLADIAAPFDRPLPEPRSPADHFSFDGSLLTAARELIARRASSFGLGDAATGDLLLAANEIATNSVVHGPGRGTLRIWDDGDALICEIRDSGRIIDPLVGRKRPVPTSERGRGIWLANQLCDLVQIRTAATGTAVRLHKRLL